MRTFLIFKRELASYFCAPIAYAYAIAFLVSAGLLTFFVGNFFERGEDNLQSFFAFHPWLYLVLVPGLSMRMWAEERRTGTIELLLTLPVRSGEAVLGKFLAAWFFAGLILTLTFPFWLTTHFLGQPDDRIIFTGYLGSWLLAGTTLAIGAAISATTKNQVLAFVITAIIVSAITAAGISPILGLLRGRAPEGLVDAVASASIVSHFTLIARGAVDLRDLFFFGSVIVALLAATTIIVDLKKAD